MIDNSALRENTVVIYVSDHGEMAGHHGIWQKQCFYEHAVRVPMIVRMPGEGGARRVSSGANLVDILPTLLDLSAQEPVAALPGTSLVNAVKGEDLEDRAIFSEYHALGATSGGFMIRKGDWKYIHYVGMPDQLFNVVDDPDEGSNRAGDSECGDILKELHAELLEVVDPEAVDLEAKENQKLKGTARAGREG